MTTEHGIQGGWYNNLGGAMVRCVLECLCGAEFSGPSWESAGRDLDDHLMDAQDAADMQEAMDA